MTVRPYQHEFALIERGDFRIVDCDKGQRDVPFFCGVKKRCSLVSAGIEAQQGKTPAKEVERGAPVGKERVRGPMSGPCCWRIASWIVWRCFGAVRPANRRAFVAIAKMGAEGEPF